MVNFERRKYDLLCNGTPPQGISLVSPKYFRGCMQKRNRYMVDNSSLLIAYVYSNRGGSVQTRNYAIKKDKIIIDV